MLHESWFDEQQGKITSVFYKKCSVIKWKGRRHKNQPKRPNSNQNRFLLNRNIAYVT